jgi:hypothetical protein
MTRTSLGTMKLERSFLLLVLLMSGCASPGFIVNGVRVSDEEMAKYRAAWKPGARAAAALSAVHPKEHQGILDLIAMLESRGATKQPPCESLVLTQIVRGPGNQARFASGQMFGPLSLYEDWRVLACGRKHSWIALVGVSPRYDLNVVFAETPEGDWIRMGVSGS